MGLKERYKSGLITNVDAILEATEWTKDGSSHGIEACDRFIKWIHQRESK